MDDALTNDAKRKAAVEAGYASSNEVRSAQSQVRKAKANLESVKSDYEKLRDTRRAVEFAQTAAGHIITAYTSKEYHGTSSRQQPESYVNGR